MTIDLEAEVFDELWHSLLPFLSIKDQELAAVQFITWLSENGMPDEQLTELARSDDNLAQAVKEVLGLEDLIS